MRNKKKLFLLSGASLLICIAVIGVIIIGIIPRRAEVLFESTPSSEVYVDGELIGNTPQTIETLHLNIVIKLVPQENGYLPYETALSLTPYTKTIVRHNFSNASSSTTQILGFKKISENSSPMTILTNPDNSYVFIDNQYVGTSPLRLEKAPSTYSLQVMHTGFQAMQVSVKNAKNYELTAFLSLAYQTQNAKPLQQSQNQTALVTVKKTPTGYLRVHENPLESASEIARTEVGREYTFEGYSPLKDWIEIRLNASQSGWIRSEYASVSGYIATPP